MFSIGEFARHGRVSVRMLRHYDAIGLLRPACVDRVSGYRFYQASQLAELNRVIALKDLGFTLQQVQTILEEKVTAAELRGMLKLRRAEIHAQIEAETARLARVEARLMTIEDEARVPADGVVIKRLAPVRVGELTGEAAGYGWAPAAWRQPGCRSSGTTSSTWSGSSRSTRGCRSARPWTVTARWWPTGSRPGATRPSPTSVTPASSSG